LIFEEGRILKNKKEFSMFISTFSSHEIYAKHRNQSEIRGMEQRRHAMEARSYRYGNPLNTRREFRVDARAARDDRFQTAKPNALALLRSLLFTH
jgi:hypothetical protein